MTDESGREFYAAGPSPSSFILNYMTLRQSQSAEHSYNGTKQRVTACRKRMRRTRAVQRDLRFPQDEDLLSADELVLLVENDTDDGDSLKALGDAGASALRKRKGFAPEV